ncbi:MAG TPA: hypothetical protein DD827_11260, partial [Gammaproteobacteria bacterium]|nr:hypothetical protein [Gammaproteobacteria bacterium]
MQHINTKGIIMNGLSSSKHSTQPKSKKIWLAVVATCLLFIVTPSHAAEKLFSAFIIPDAPGVTDGTGGLQTASIANIQVNLDTAIAGALTPGQQLDVPLLDGQTLLGTVQQAITNAAGDTVQILSLQDGKGGLELTVSSAGVVTEMLLFDSTQNKFFRAALDSNGSGAFILEDTNDHVCLEFPLPPEAALEAPAAGIEEITLDLATLQSLQSRPGAPNVIYLDYWGGTLSGTIWNVNHNDGNDIVYTPYSIDSDATNFSAADLNQIWLGWREAAEDFAPFNVNVTTDPAVYDAVTNPHRVRNISTTTNDFYSNAGGVAYLYSFDDTNDYKKVSWTWNRYPSSHGMTISHEVGHQLGLRHDGTSSLGYYRGHGEWGPVMGAPFGKEYVQWSKGEYPDASRTEDDIAIIDGNLGTAADDAGDSIAAATTIGTQVTDQEGQIKPLGLGNTPDIDVYTFTLASPAATQIDIKPLIIDDD